MIEIELKLKVDKFPDLSNLKCVKEKRILDLYYDTKDYKLISTGNFLRNRDNKKIDFKLNTDDLSHTYCKETSFGYEGFKDNASLKQIFDNIGIAYNPNFNNFEEFLSANNLTLLAVIDKTRKEYELENLLISLDDAKDIGKFIEIELDVADDEIFDKDQITNQMLETMQKYGYLPKYEKVNIGYVELYLKEHNKKAYNLGLYK